MTNGEGQGAEQKYRMALNRGEFLIQRCLHCAKHIFYPREMCPFCGFSTLEWIKPSGLGFVYSTTVVRKRADAGGHLNVVLVDLDEGVRVMSRVEKVAPEEVVIGQRVIGEVRVDDGVGILVFHLVDRHDMLQVGT